MRVAIVLAGLLGILLPSSNAYADACVDAARRQNANARKENVWFSSAIKGLGIPWKDVDSSKAEHCIKLVPIYKAKIPYLEEGVRLDRAMDRVCPPSRVDLTPGKGATRYISSAENLSTARDRIDRCERIIAAANSAPEPRSAPTGSQQSVSCSDITGTGGSAPAATHCKNSDRSLYAARKMRKANPQAAVTEYNKAAVAARSAGDTTLELSILREAADPDSADSPANTDAKVAVVTPPSSVPPPAPATENSGSSRWLPPTSPNRTTPEPTPTPPRVGYDLGNRPIGPGPRVTNPATSPTHGLKLVTRRKLDSLRGDPARRTAYLNTLTQRERTQAQAYLNDPRTYAMPVVGSGSEPASSEYCAAVLQQAKSRVPGGTSGQGCHEGSTCGYKWIEWHMNRSYCHMTGEPYSNEEKSAEMERRLGLIPNTY